MSEVNVASRTQIIIVDPVSSSVSVIHAGPMGPAGVPGMSGDGAVDATTVAAAGAVMETDTSTALMQFVIDEDAMVSNSATKIPTQQSVKAYVDANAGSGSGSGSDGYSYVLPETTPPASPTVGQTWFAPDTGNTYLRYNDGTTTWWMQSAATAGILGEPGPGLPSGGTIGQIPTKASSLDYDTVWADAGAASVTTENVTAAGALMDSEVDLDIKTFSLPANTTISVFGASLIDDAAASNARTTLELGTAATAATSAFDAAGTAASAVAALKATVYGVVNHGATAGTARPTGFAGVIWYGSVQPTNMVAPDIVIRTDEAV